MTCKVCNDTGDTGSGYLDCYHCNAAEIKMLNNQLIELATDYLNQTRNINERIAALTAETIEEAA